MYTLEDGTFAVRTARQVIEAAVLRQEFTMPKAPEKFSQKSGVFVTINTFPRHNLRGCIGFPEPVYVLMEALEGAAQSAALRDPRFPSVREDELGDIVIEVSLLTPPELITVNKPKQYLKEVKIGRDGLIVERGMAKGLLLPQVPVEWKWKTDEFLEHTCMKAGLSADCWLQEGTKIYKFSAEIFAEVEPGGNIVAKSLGD